MRIVALVLVVAVGLGSARPAEAYLKFAARVDNGVVDIRWTRPVPYFINETGIAEVTPVDLRGAVSRAFATWQAVSTAAVSSQFQGFTAAPPGQQDDRTTFGFVDRPDLDRVLGATSFLIDSATGEIREADVFFNTRFAWSVAPAGIAGRVDLESIALHEIGHLLGLGHSALGETEMGPTGRRVVATGAVMFPIALSAGATAERQLHADDIAGISDIYPGATFATATSSIAGRVLKNGAPVFGAHVVAVNLASGVAIGGFALSEQGEFAIAGVPPGTYVLRTEPLDDADTDSFFSGPIDVDFPVTYGSRVIVAPAGAGSARVDIVVRGR